MEKTREERKMSDLSEMFWDSGCFNRGNRFGALDFLDKVAQIITDEVPEVCASVVRGFLGYYIILRRVDIKDCRIHVVGSGNLLILTYDGTDAISTVFAEKTIGILQRRISKAYTNYRELSTSYANNEVRIQRIIETM